MRKNPTDFFTEGTNVLTHPTGSKYSSRNYSDIKNVSNSTIIHYNEALIEFDVNMII